jgi:hypothetical protein
MKRQLKSTYSTLGTYTEESAKFPDRIRRAILFVDYYILIMYDKKWDFSEVWVPLLRDAIFNPCKKYKNLETEPNLFLFFVRFKYNF